MDYVRNEKRTLWGHALRAVWGQAGLPLRTRPRRLTQNVVVNKSSIPGYCCPCRAISLAEFSICLLPQLRRASRIKSVVR